MALEERMADLGIEDEEDEEDSSVNTEDVSEDAGADDSEEESEEEPTSDGSDSEEEDDDLPASVVDSDSESPTDPEDSDGEEDTDMEETVEAPAQSTTLKNKRKRTQPEKWLREVRHYQDTTHLLIPRLPFQRLVREMAQDDGFFGRFTKSAVEALQVASEDMLVTLFGDAQRLAIHRDNETICPKDIYIARHLYQRVA